MKNIQFRKFIFITSVSTAIIVGCSRDNDNNIDMASPAVRLAESEKLSIPPAIDLPSNDPNGNTRVATFYANGVQIYKAKLIAGSTPAQYEWVFVAPRADLFNVVNAKVGTHSAGPTWQLLGSTTDSIYGQAFTPAKAAPSSDSRSIDWLQLMPKTGKAPTGLFTNVSYIQRIATNGGKAPLAAPVGATDSVEVPYTAVYRFTKKNP
jgi:hypothetical protein